MQSRICTARSVPLRTAGLWPMLYMVPTLTSSQPMLHMVPTPLVQDSTTHDTCSRIDAVCGTCRSCIQHRKWNGLRGHCMQHASQIDWGKHHVYHGLQIHHGFTMWVTCPGPCTWGQSLQYVLWGTGSWVVGPQRQAPVAGHIFGTLALNNFRIAVQTHSVS